MRAVVGVCVGAQLLRQEERMGEDLVGSVGGGGFVVGHVPTYPIVSVVRWNLVCTDTD